MGKKTEIGKMEAVIEAILFTMGESVELKKIAAAIEHDEATTRKIIHRLQDKYEAEDRSLHWLARPAAAKVQSQNWQPQFSKV